MLSSSIVDSFRSPLSVSSLSVRLCIHRWFVPLHSTSVVRWRWPIAAHSLVASLSTTRRTSPRVDWSEIASAASVVLRREIDWESLRMDHRRPASLAAVRNASIDRIWTGSSRMNSANVQQWGQRVQEQRRVARVIRGGNASRSKGTADADENPLQWDIVWSITSRSLSLPREHNECTSHSPRAGTPGWSDGRWCLLRVVSNCRESDGVFPSADEPTWRSPTSLDG